MALLQLKSWSGKWQKYSFENSAFKQERVLIQESIQRGKTIFLSAFYFFQTVSGSLFSYNSQTEQATTAVHKAFVISSIAFFKRFFFLFYCYEEKKPTKPEKPTHLKQASLHPASQKWSIVLTISTLSLDHRLGMILIGKLLPSCGKNLHLS